MTPIITRHHWIKYWPKTSQTTLGWFYFILLGIFAYFVLAIVSEPINEPSLPLILAQKMPRYYETDVSAYNVGDKSQTDDSPCIGAYGDNLCDLLADGQYIVASNYWPKNTIIRIDGVNYRVLDKMNRRYKYEIDIAYPLSQKVEAINYGRQVKDILIIK